VQLDLEAVIRLLKHPMRTVAVIAALAALCAVVAMTASASPRKLTGTITVAYSKTYVFDADPLSIAW